MFQLAWRQHGGSGLGLAPSEVEALAVGDRNWLLERVAEQRSKEARELDRAARRR